MAAVQQPSSDRAVGYYGAGPREAHLAGPATLFRGVPTGLWLTLKVLVGRLTLSEPSIEVGALPACQTVLRGPARAACGKLRCVRAPEDAPAVEAGAAARVRSAGRGTQQFGQMGGIPAKVPYAGDRPAFDVNRGIAGG